MMATAHMHYYFTILAIEICACLLFLCRFENSYLFIAFELIQKRKQRQRRMFVQMKQYQTILYPVHMCTQNLTNPFILILNRKDQRQTEFIDKFLAYKHPCESVKPKTKTKPMDNG